LLVLALGWIAINLLLRSLERILIKRFPDAVLRAFVLSLAGIGAKVLLFISCLDILGISVASLLTALGAVGLALGLAMQDSLGNLAQGVVLLFTRPFTLGDYIEIDGFLGVVEDISLLHVTICTADRKRVFITNGQAVKAKIINHSAMPERRLEFISEISVEDNLAEVIAILEKLLQEHPLRSKSREPSVFLSGQSDTLLQINCRVWVNSSNYWELYFSLLTLVRQEYAAAAIACPAGKQLLRLETNPLP